MTLTQTPTVGGNETARRAASRRRRRLGLPIAVLLLTFATPIVWSLSHALTAPGTDSVAARIAEWARDHHAGSLVTWMERATYRPPKVGGHPAPNSPLAQRPAPPPRPKRPAATSLQPVASPASPALPGEGQWHVLATVRGRPALQVAFVRPDAVHTSYTAAIVRINPSLVRAQFRPGSVQPGGGPWPTPPYLQGQDRVGLLAAFNSAFRLRDARGGFFNDGRTVAALRPGAASLVVYKNGGMMVGAWGRDVGMTPNVAAVRQNLLLVVDHGQPVPGLMSNVRNAWGYTLGNSAYVWRSGIGVRPDGTLVYVAGNRLSALTLADLLVRAGATRAMELDINPEWTSFVLYRAPDGSVIERNVLPDMQGSPRRYDQNSSRDFLALYAR